MRYRDLELFDFQEQAIRAIEAGKSVIVSAPTGAGKTIIAEFAIERALREGRRVVYTSPIKALSNQKFRDFSSRYPEKVGIMTGDVTVNPGAPVQIMTTEIFRNTIFEDRERLHGIDFVVFDEVHYLGDPDRGSVWEECILFAPHEIRFVGLSATIGNLEEFRSWMEQVRGSEVVLIHTDERPVPLHKHLFIEEVGIIEPRELKNALRKARARPDPSSTPGTRRNRLLGTLIREERLPILYFSFSRRRCEQMAARWQRKSKLLSPQERREVLELYDDLIERYGAWEHPAAQEMRRNVGGGVLYHHAGMLPVFKDVVERLFCSGLVKVLFTTETFALGVNMPARSVVFDSLAKFNGVDTEYITPLEFRQMAGRAGRQGIDVEGEVFAILDPETDSARAIGDIIHKRPGAIESRFALGYSTILSLEAMLGEEIEEAVKRSFSAFQKGSAERPVADLRAKMRVLEDRGYRTAEGPTGKGRFCSRINGFEVHLTEIFWDGCLEDLDPVQLAALCSSIVYAPRGRNLGGEVMRNPVPSAIANRARKRIGDFRKAETRNRLLELSKPLDFGLAAVIDAWCSGADFSIISRTSNMQDGDVVRQLRLTIQVLRQLSWALTPNHHVADACKQAISLLDRDEVDAERQLRVG